MNRNTTTFLKILGVGALAASVAQADLVRHPSKVSMYVDVGQIVQGQIYSGASPQGEVEGQMLNRTGVYLTESATYNDRLTVSMTVGGLFWFALPETRDFQDRRVQFGPGVGRAQGVYRFGEDPTRPVATLQFGLFPHKYSDAVNLGEYLYRSGTYPATLTSGGWSYINSASYLAQGVRLNVPMLNGMLSHDFTLYMERGLAPVHDLTPGYMITVKPVPFLEVGAGVVWSNAISFNSDRLAPEQMGNAYSKATGRPVTGDPNPGPCSVGTPDPVDPVNNPPLIPGGVDHPDCGFYTFRGLKTSARLAFDIGQLIGHQSIRAGEFKLYSEVALLGVENQTFFYEDRLQRMPVMVGLNIPTFGILDRLAVEGEYLATAFPNNNAAVLQQQFPIPVTDPYELDGNGDPKFDRKDKRYDEIKWTAYARRKITDGISVYAQAASDHQRHFDRAVVPGAETSTPKASDWYYILRLEFGI